MTRNHTVTTTTTALPDGSAEAGSHPAGRPDWAVSLRQHREAFGRGAFLRVVNYHNTPRSALPDLRRDLTSYAERFAPVTLADLDRFYDTGEWASDRPGFLPVFYEGYRNNAEVAAPLLDELGLVGWFFVCTGFLDAPEERQEAYARAHHIGLVEEDLAGGPIAMSWDQLAALSSRHVLNPHTASHESTDWILTEADVAREIVEPKQKVDAATGRASACIAWLHGTPYGHQALNDEAVRRAGYRYVVSNTMIQRLPGT